MKEEAVCAVYYTTFTENLVRTDLHQYQKKLALDMLRQGFSDFFLCTDFDETQIKRTELGKPYYAKNPDWHFNISHCRDAVAVAISKYPVGIDVESMRKIKPAVVRKCCKVEEFQYVMDTGTKDADRDELSLDEKQRFLHLWTLKESYVKMTGEGLRMAVDSIAFETEKFYREGDVLVCPKEESADSFSCLYFPENLVLAVTVRSGGDGRICYRQIPVCGDKVNPGMVER